jgi:Na+/melibiose symporter-like transporter
VSGLPAGTTASGTAVWNSLFANRGFVAGLALGTLFFSAVTGTLYVTTLYLQQRLGLSPLHAALTLAPVSIGIIAASFTARSHVTARGRTVVALGVTLYAVGVAGLTAVVGADSHPVPWITVPLLVIGLGMDCCFGSIFGVALGDVTEAQAGSASGVLNALQQIINATGSALMSTIYLAASRPGAASSGVLPCLALTLVITAACATSIPLLPRNGADTHGA